MQQATNIYHSNLPCRLANSNGCVSYAATADVAGANAEANTRSFSVALSVIVFTIKNVLYVYGRLAKYPVKFPSSKAMSAPNQYTNYTR